MVKIKELFIFSSLLILGIFFIYIYNYINKAQDDIYSRVESNKVKQLTYLFKNIEKDIVLKNNIDTKESLISLFSDSKSRTSYEERLELLVTPSIQYIYLLTKDKKNRFRFLLDASKTDKANFYQKFDVKNIKYKELYTTKTVQVIRQKNMDNLYLTILYPIITNNEVIGVLSADITTEIHTIILEIIKPLETFFIVLIIFIFLLILMTVIQIFHYFITRKKIFTDPRTKLFNRNYLQEIIPMLNLNNYSIAMLDLDRFKIINDTYGHKTGDYILSKSSAIMKHSIRESDILIRYGGEEFLLFIYNRDEGDTAINICERIRRNINIYNFTCSNHDIKMQVSIGIHENPSLEKNLNEAIKIADKMLYIAKSEGRNRVIQYNESSKVIEGVKTKDINFVKHVLEDNRIICYYQPIYNYENNTIVKYEALVRLLDKDMNIISPIYFLPNLKHTNIHYKLTQKILSLVFEEFKNRDESVSINLNFSDLINDDIEATIIDVLTNDKNLASRVTFEILESDEINNIILFKEKIVLLHSLGAKISIDDFGSGYSNFKTILDIEANFLKIDGSLIKNMDINEKDFKIVKSIIHFAKEAGMKTIAEFVHSKNIYDKLQQLDLDYMQGYYIAKPSPTVLTVEDLFQD